MNELEEIRAQLHAIRTITASAIERVDSLVERTREPEPEEEREPPRTFGGGKPTPPENKSHG